MTRTQIILAGAIAVAIWLLWPRKGIPMFDVGPVIIKAGGAETNEP
jgi:hypothetical protein